MAHPSGPRPKLTVSFTRREQVVVIGLAGELDLHTVPVLRQALQSQAVWSAPATRAVIVDLGATTFCDSSGLGELIAMMNHGQAAGILLLLSAVPPVMARMLAITGLDAAFTVCPDLDAALRRAAPG